MKDLLKEEEFIKKPYNPWKLFCVFYAIAFIQFLLFIVTIVAFNADAGPNTALAAFLIPNITAFTMFFFKKKNALLPAKTIVVGTGLLFGVYTLPATVMSLFGSNTIGGALGFLVIVLADYLICISIMLLIARARKAGKQEKPQ